MLTPNCSDVVPLQQMLAVASVFGVDRTFCWSMSVFEAFVHCT